MEIDTTLFWGLILIAIVIFCCLAFLLWYFTRKQKEELSEEEKADKLTAEYKKALEELEQQPIEKVVSVSKKSSKKAIPVKDSEPVNQYTPEVVETNSSNAPNFNILDKKRRKKNKSFFKAWFKFKFRRGELIIISMDLPNGDKEIEYAVVQPDDTILMGKGKYKKRYKLDIDKRYYIQNLGMYGYDFNEEISIPYKSRLTILEAKTKARGSPDTLQIENLLNPKTLHDYSENQFAQSLIAGGKLADEFRQIKLFLYISTGAGILTLMYLLFKTGAFEQIQGLAG